MAYYTLIYHTSVTPEEGTEEDAIRWVRQHVEEPSVIELNDD